MENIKAIIFDMDGVLLDSESICDKTWVIASKEMNIPMDEKTLNDCRGCNKSDTMQILKNRYGSDFDSAKFLSRTSELFYEVENRDGIALMPYVKETLEYLSKKYVLCLASSTRMESVSRQLKNAGIIDYFKTLTTGDMVTHSKPDPQIYLMACESIGMKSEECIAIEDSYNGVRSAVSANLKAIMVPDKLPPTDEMKAITFAICDSLKNVQEIL